MSEDSFQLGWEKLFGDAIPSTQEAVELLGPDHFESNYFDVDVDSILSTIELDAALFSTSEVFNSVEQQSQHPVPSTSAPLCDVTAGRSRASYGSPKSKIAVERAMADGVPVKTKNQTKWAVVAWNLFSIYLVHSSEMIEINISIHKMI